MKNDMLTVVLLAAVVGFGSVAAGAESETVDLKPRDLTPVTWLEAPKHAPVEIVRDGKAVAVVYAVDMKFSESHGDRFPALVDELLACIRESTGVTLERVKDPPPAGQPAIFIGEYDESLAAGIDPAKMPPEGFAIKTAPNRVYLVGGQADKDNVRGANDATCLAVLDFMERVIGARWYWEIGGYGGYSPPPKRASLGIPPFSYRDQPASCPRTMYPNWYWLQARAVDEEYLLFPKDIKPESWTKTLNDDDQFYRMRHKGEGWFRCQPAQGGGVASTDHYSPGYTTGYTSICPEAPADAVFLAVRDDGSRRPDVLCYSAPGTLDHHLAALDRAWGGTGGDVRPSLGAGITRSHVSVWAYLMPDGRPAASVCRCAECAAARARGGDALVMGRFVQRLCEEVKKRWPDKMVAYTPWTLTECPDELKFPNNLVVSVLHLGELGVLSRPETRDAAEHALRAWSAKSGRPVDVCFDFAGPNDWTYGPVQFPHLVQDFYKKNRESLAGSMVLCYGRACFITAAPTYYVLNRVMWNPDLDVDATLDEMCRRLFGAGASPARELLRLECDRWEKTACTRPLRPGEYRIPPRLFTEIWPPDVVARMRALRHEALTAIEDSGDGDARQSFLFWTWTFDAFIEYAGEVERVLASGEGKTPAVAAATGPANADAGARFQGGTGAANRARIVNVSTNSTAAGQSDVDFDLAWRDAWRAKWTEPAANNVSGKDLPVESWSAAWVFAKYRRGQSYAPATLAADRADHTVPAGAMLDVGLTTGKGVGVFIYRAAAGHGPLDLKDMKLRWLHEADGVKDPATAELKVFVLDMVHVPRGAFAVGSGGTERGSFTDGVWTDGATIPFLVDETWSASRDSSANSRRLGNVPGRLWGLSRDGVASIGPEGAIADEFPAGHEAFYCMRYEVTQGQFADFLNTISPGEFAATTAKRGQTDPNSVATGRYGLSGEWPKLEATKPDRACSMLSWRDGVRFAAWAGLRPMTELEFEKACRGPLKPVPNEYAWGTAAIALKPYTLDHEGRADETVAANYSKAAGNANFDFTMPDFHGLDRPGRRKGYVQFGTASVLPGSPMRAGIFATPDSGRVAAGASYWGIMELSGNVREQVVSLGSERGRVFQGTHGDGTTRLPADWPNEKDGIGSGSRGGFFGDAGFGLRVSDRHHAIAGVRDSGNPSPWWPDQDGWRAVRSAPEAEQARLKAGFQPQAVAPASLRHVNTVPLLKKPPRIDGKLDDWPTTDRPAAIRRDINDVKSTLVRDSVFWDSAADLGIKVWWGHDGKALCLAFEVSDDRHFNTQTGDMIWNGDALQVGGVNAKGVQFNFMVALTDKGVAFHKVFDKDQPLAKVVERAVVRDNATGTTRYELRLPLTALGIEPGAEFGYNFMVFDDDDGKGQRCWFQLGPGMNWPFKPELYPRFVIGK